MEKIPQYILEKYAQKSGLFRKNILKFIVVGILSIFLFTGCTSSKTRYMVKVDSIGSTQNKINYMLLSSVKDITVDDLQFKEYAKYIHNAFKEKRVYKNYL